MRDDRHPDHNDDETPAPRWWPVVEVVVGGGLLASIVGVAFGSVWYFAVEDKTITDLGDKVTSIQTQVSGLDNVALGNRLTALETMVRDNQQSNERVEGKLDRLIERVSQPTR